MPCPACLNNERSYHYAGADTTFHDPKLPKDVTALAYEPNLPVMTFPDSEIKVCEKCDSVWHFHYWFADHPPLIVFGDIINTRDEFRQIREKITNIMLKNLEIGNMQEDEFKKYESNLQALADRRFK